MTVAGLAIVAAVALMVIIIVHVVLQKRNKAGGTPILPERTWTSYENDNEDEMKRIWEWIENEMNLKLAK